MGHCDSVIHFDLAADYVRRAALRMHAIDALYRAEAWADVVRECQEAVELALKGLLRAVRVDPPRVHDVSALLLDQAEQLPEVVRWHARRMAHISRELHRDGELAFYGTEDLVPSEFYEQGDANRARDNARFVIETATAAMRHIASTR